MIKNSFSQAPSSPRPSARRHQHKVRWLAYQLLTYLPIIVTVMAVGLFSGSSSST